MVMLKSLSSHKTCSAYIQKYLERDGRNLNEINWGHNLGFHKNNWAAYMDAVRHEQGCDTAIRGKDAVTFQHFIISPDPQDNCSMEQLHSLVDEWITTWFGSEEEDGLLGAFQTSAVVHDDNENGILHCHVIVNNVNLCNGKRLHLDTRDNKAMARTLQEMGEKRGLHFFEEDTTKRNRPVSQKRNLTITEKQLRQQNKFVWKDDLANLISIAKRTSYSKTSFLQQLAFLGVHVDMNNEGDDWIYTHVANPARWKVSSKTLGGEFARDTLRGELSDEAKANRMAYPSFVNRVNTLIADAVVAEVDAVASNDPLERENRVAAVAETLRVMDEWSCPDSYSMNVTIAALRSEISRAPEGRAEQLKAGLSELLKARETAIKFGLITPKVSKEKSGEAGNKKSNKAGSNSGRVRTQNQKQTRARGR